MAMSTLPPEIIQTHILTRLCCSDLAIASCTSSQLRNLSNDQKLWQEICNSIWKSTLNSNVHRVVSTFPDGHRSFFVDSSLYLDHGKHCNDQRRSYCTGGSELISAVDIYYKGANILSRVRETNATTSKFLSAPFRVDLLDSKENVSTPIPVVGKLDSFIKHLEQNLKLSWILINPSIKRAATMSSRSPVSLVWPCSSAGEARLHYATIIGGERDFIKCKIVVICNGLDEGEVKVGEVSMQMKDMDGENLNGKDSMVILHGALMSGRVKKKCGEGEEGKVRYEEYVKRKTRRKDRKKKKDDVIDLLCGPAFVFIFTWVFAFLGLLFC